MKRLVIVEDQTSVRELLAEVFRQSGTYDVVGEAGEGSEAVDLCLRVEPEVCLLDAKLPGMNGAEVLRRVVKRLPRLRVLVFSGYETPDLVREMIEAGAHGFVEKTAPIDEVRKGLDIVAAGGTYFGPAIADLLRSVVANPGSERTGDRLTIREREILRLVAESNSTREIAAKLGISTKTVDNHRTNLMRKLDLHDVASLTRYALNTGLIESKPKR
jgi:DNA-binding NarL/FixJ family response regulator